MPITLDAFRAAIQSKNDNGFVELKGANRQVSTYATGFFARTFGWYRTRSAETNRAVRQQFYEALSEPGACQENVLAAIKDRLGLNDTGGGVKDRPLSIRDIRTMMAWAEKSTKIEKFEVQASPEFSNWVINEFRDMMKSNLALPDNTPDTVLWNQSSMDINREGFDFTVNGTRLCAVFDSAETTQEQVDKTANQAGGLFKSGTPNDRLAGKIFSGIAHQGLGGVFQTGKCFFGNTMPEVGSDQTNVVQFSPYYCNIQRQSDGSYDLDVSITQHYLMTSDDLGNQRFYTGNSEISYSAKMKLSFNENGDPSLEFRNQEPPVIKGTRQECPFTSREVNRMRNIASRYLGEDNGEAFPSLLNATDMMHGLELRTKMDELAELDNALQNRPNNRKLQNKIAQKKDDIRTFIKQHVIIETDKKRLKALGVSNSLCNMLSSNWGGTPRLDHKLMAQLNSPDAKEREKGLATLQNMCRQINDLGYTSNEIMLNTKNTAIMDIGGFSLDSKNEGGSDAEMLLKYCGKHPQEHLLEDLNAGNPETVGNAKKKLEDILVGERRNVGTTLLQNQYDFSAEDLRKLKNNIGTEQLSAMMEHVYTKDADMEATLAEFRQTLKA